MYPMDRIQQKHARQIDLLDVFYLYSTGISHNAIARILNISISTSKKHASLICDYFSVSNKDELIILLYNKKFIHYLYEKAMCIINTR